MKTLIIGASGELGEAIAHKLSNEKHKLILHGYSNLTRLNNIADEVGAEAVFTGDMKDEEQVKTIIENSNKSENISGIVYSAGINPTADTLENTSSKIWNETLSVNLTGAFLCIKYSLPFLRTQASSSIVLISSTFGISSPANRSAYGASKHGLTGLVQSVAKEEGENVRINGVCPGSMWSENVRNIFSRHAKSVGMSVEDYIKQRRSQIPSGRFLELQECASVVSFLLSKESSFLTGEMIRISGGES
jgi:3-oxoacyl-[acyl-carrier protein] reductase